MIRRLARRPDLLAWAVAAVPLLVAAGRALAVHWHPIGDNAFFSLRARDVLTGDHPLLGTWTSASLSVGRDMNNPGPLYFDLLALPTKVGPVAGTVVGVVAVNLAAVALAVRWAARTAGAAGAWAAALACATLQWAMGSAILVEPWQPHSLLLPFLAYLVLVWALAAGHLDALPWAVGVGSLIVQTHLSYAVVVPALGGAALLACLVRPGAADPGPAPTARRPGRFVWGATGAVAALAWAQTVVDQVWGEGNLTTVLAHATGGERSAGLGFAARAVAAVVAVPGSWGRGGFAGARVDTSGPSPEVVGLAGGGTALAWAAVALAAAGGAGWLCWRRRQRAWGSGLAVAVLAATLGVLTMTVLPVSDRLGIGAHQMRLLWPIALFGWTVVLGSLVVALVRTAAPWVVAAAVVAVALAGVPAHSPLTGPSLDAPWAIPTTRALLAQLDGAPELAGVDVVHLDLSVIRFAEPYSTPVMLELDRQGIDFLVDGPTVPQVGSSRAFRADDDVDLTMRVVEGGAAARPEAGWRRIAYAEGESPFGPVAVLVR